ncbi:MAG: type II toxin-antitoxin system prevent-host-death family antitoxin [Beijerinckiaceae bacterium]|jgi:prevent-host-death family protein|nr:type II toxin-antitoxin system prevent-host-death family antitoxin [Beijerinckiaceae bacterium]
MATYTLAQAKDQLSKLVDEAMTGAPVTITRHGKPAVHLMAAHPESRPMTQADLDWLAERRATRPYVDIDSGAFIRAMRDEEPE